MRAPRSARRLALCLCAALLATAAGVGLWLAFRSGPRPVHIAINPWPGYEFAFLAKAKGFFRDEGVEVHLVEMASLSDNRRAFELGRVDGFFGTPVELLVAESISGRRGTTVLVVDASEGADTIIARDPIESMASLRGRRIGVERGSLHMLILGEALELAGTRLDEVTLVHLPTADAPRAFAAGEIDAAVCYPPFSLEMMKDPAANELFSTRAIPGEVVDILVLDEAFVRSRADDVERVRRAYFRAQRFAVEHREEALAIMASRHRISPEEFAGALDDGIRILTESDQADYLGGAGRLPGILARTRAVLTTTGELPPDDQALTDAELATPTVERGAP